MKNTRESLRKQPLELIFLLAIFTSIGALTIDLQLPAMPDILSSFGFTEANQQQWIITAYMIGFAVAQIIYGPVSDSVGRKPVLMFGLLIYLLASLLCVVAETYLTFLLARSLQGVGAAAARIMVNAITRDMFAGNEMARVTSLVMMIFIMVPVLAPSMGSLILWLGDWHDILYVFIGFALLAMSWSWFRLPETLASRHRKPFHLSQLRQTFKAVISEPVSMVFAVVSGIIFSGFMAYLNSAEQLFSDLYQVSQYFPVIFGTVALFFGVAAFINARMVMRYGALTITTVALTVMMLCNGLAVLVALFYQGLPPIWVFLTSLVLINICIGLIYGNVMAIAMYPLSEHAGMGASVIGMISALLASLLGVFISQQLESTIMPILLGFLLTSFSAWLLVHRYRDAVSMED
jgi:DHA1 family bicyclomycin/chloramphenicol resistance-like MFS transporter